MTTRVGVPNDGEAVTVAPGGLLEIALPENATTGYRWELDPLPAGAAVVGDRVEAPDTRAAGAAGLRVFAIRPGHGGTVSARLRRSWETVEPVRTFSVRVRPR
ncbi:MAG: inhibitor of cysteine peptidase [Micromonosporaceae bacterium]